MLKKTIAAFLVVAMLVCFSAVPGLAVSDDEVMTDEAVQAAVEDVFAEFVDADDLALHIIAVKALEPVYDSNRRFSLIGLLFRQFVDADLNIDEWRIPGFIIVAIGKYILNTVYNRIK